jgi:hypothetical protein
VPLNDQKTKKVTSSQNDRRFFHMFQVPFSPRYPFPQGQSALRQDTGGRAAFKAAATLVTRAP